MKVIDFGVSKVESVKYKAADGLEITGYLTLPNGREAKGLPLIVFPHGGPASRDTLGFDWWAQAMASRGYAVLQVNFRGSDGLGWEFTKAGFGEWGRKMQTDLSDGVRNLTSQGVVDPKRVCIVGGSYGGYAALAGATLQKDVYRCAVSFGGVDLPFAYSSANSLGNMMWAPYSFTFVATGSSELLSFAADGSAGCCYGPALDNVSIAAVPEPATWSMMLLGFGAVGVGLRRRKPRLGHRQIA